MSSHGFGIPTMAAIFHSRILGGTLHGCEVLASCRACLPLDHPARITAFHRRFTNIPDTWMIASWEILTKDLKIEHDLSDTWSSIPIDVTKNPKARKLFVSNYCSNYVLPKMRRLDHAWFTGQLSKLNTDGLIPYADLVPLHQCWTAREPVF